MEVRIQDAVTAKPVQNARVRLWDLDSGAPPQLSDQDGIATCSRPSEGFDLVVVECRGYVSAIVPLPIGDTRLVVELKAGRQFQGTVLDAATSSPVAAAAVYWSCMDETSVRLNSGSPVLTGVDGRFEVTIPEGLSMLRLYAIASGTRAVSVDVDPAAPGHDLVLRVGEGATVSGCVFSEDGRPVAGCVVSLVRPLEALASPSIADVSAPVVSLLALRDRLTARAVTGPAGEYRIRGLSESLGQRGPYAVCAVRPDGSRAWSSPFEVPPGGRNVHRDVAYANIATLVIDVSDAGLVPSEVSVEAVESAVRFDRAQGAVARSAFTGLAAGLYDVSVRGGDESGAFAKATRRVFLAGADPLVVRFGTRESSSLIGVVIDSKGRPVSHARAMFESTTADGREEVMAGCWTDAKGAFALTRLTSRPGNVTVQVPASEARGAWVPDPNRAMAITLTWRGVEARQREIRFELPGGRQLIGRVMGPSPGALQANWRDEDVAGCVAVAVQSDGTFATPLPTALEPRAVWLSANGFAPVPVEGLDAQSDRDYDMGDVALSQGVLVTGRVMDPDHRPLSDAMLYCESPWTRRQVRLGTDGAFAINGIPRGELVFGVRLREHEWVYLRARADGRDLDLHVPRTVSVTGSTVAEDGSPVSRAVVRCSWSGCPTSIGWDVESGANGRFTLRLQPGSWRLGATQGALRSDVQSVNVEEGASPDVRLVLVDE